jgi:uncharacterized protein YeaO (DUF488 family)
VVVKTKRWDDPAEPDDGHRVLICRYRPRGVSKEREPWHSACPALAPSARLHAAFYGKSGPPIDFDEYERRFLGEMKARAYFIEGFAERIRRGETITLLCSSACVDEGRCHRSIVKRLIEGAASHKKTMTTTTATPTRSVVRRRR